MEERDVFASLIRIINQASLIHTIRLIDLFKIFPNFQVTHLHIAGMG